MADTKITGYAALGAAPASGDLVEIVDVSDTSMSGTGTNKKITTANLAGYMYGTAGTFTAAQTAQITDAGTNTVVYPLIVDHQSSGTPADGQGVGLAFDVETAAANTERGATIEAVTTDVTAASEDFALVVKTMVAGSTTLVEGGRWVGAQYRAPNGTAAAPAITGSDTDTGFVFGSNSIDFSAAGSSRVTISSADGLYGGLLTTQIRGFKKYILPRTSDSNVSATQTFGVLHNAGGGALVTLTLPTAVAGYTSTFYCENTNGIKIVAATGDEIRVIDKVTATAGYVQSTTEGSTITLTAMDGTTWFAESVHGVWTDGTFTYDDTSLTTP